MADNKYIPEFKEAVKLMKAKMPLVAEVYKVSPHAIYLNLVGDKIRGKLPFDAAIKQGDKINVLISYIGKDKVSVEKITE